MEPEKNISDLHVIDSHAHLDLKAFSEDLDQVIQHAKSVGVDAMMQIIMGPDDDTIIQSLNLTQQYSDFMYPTLGIHPHDAKSFNQNTLNSLQQFFKQYRIYAVGEIGLDYYYEHSDPFSQKNCFEQLLQLALDQKKPICVHTRSAFADTYAMTKSSNIFEQTGGVIHCFSEGKAQAKKFLDLGAYISFSGIVTFNSAHDIQAAAKYVPADRLLIETDSPYLAPIPFRGKRNEPAYVLKTLDFISALKGMHNKDLADQTRQNTIKLFALDL